MISNLLFLFGERNRVSRVEYHIPMQFDAAMVFNDGLGIVINFNK